MNNLEKYINAFTSTFGIDRAEAEGLKYQGIQAWDSVGHMGLIAAIEDAFGIMFEADDIVDFSSFDKGREILRKYNVEV